jgi:S1-C subfamily serine protease
MRVQAHGRGSTAQHVLRAAWLLAALCGAAAAETRYFWTDALGEHYSKDKPITPELYSKIDVPDTVAWRSPPHRGEPLTDGEPLPPQELFRQVAPSVYWVRREPNGSGFGSAAGGGKYGSAIAVSEHEAITNCHIVAEADSRLTLGAGQPDEGAEAELVAVDFDADRCVVEVKSLTLRPVTKVRSYDSLEVGEAVYAVGNPRKMARTLSTGLVSGMREREEGRLIQFTAPISPGSSGGGLFDARGNLIGVTSYSLRGAQDINFAIPAEDFWQ